MRSKSGPGITLYHYGLCELAQRQAVLLRQDKLADRAIKSDRAKVVMTAGCISRTFDISNISILKTSAAALLACWCSAVPAVIESVLYLVAKYRCV